MHRFQFFNMESSLGCMKNLFRHSHRNILVYILIVLHFLSLVTDSRNIRGHSRYSRPRPDPHVVQNSLVVTSNEFKPEESDQQPQGRRCQVTKIEENLKFFELPHYNEGRTTLPFFLKVSGKPKNESGNLIRNQNKTKHF